MDKKRAQTIVKQFNKKKVLVLGDVVIDHYVYGNVERLNPEAPVPILEAKREEERTGGGGNPAKNAAMLGCNTTLVSVTGDDTAASRVEELANIEGYVPVYIRDPSRPTIRKIRYLVGSQQMLRVDFEEVHDITSEVEKKVIATIESETRKEVDVIIVSDYAKGLLTKNIAKTITRISSRRHIPVTADVKPSHVSLLKGVSCITPNVKEAHEMLGLNPYEQGGRHPKDLASALQKKMKCDVFVTLGSGGMYVLSREGEELHVPQTHVVEVFDVSGAGDTAATVISLARACGATCEETALLANAAGAVVIGKIGSVGLTQDELIGMITHKHK